MSCALCSLQFEVASWRLFDAQVVSLFPNPIEGKLLYGTVSTYRFVSVVRRTDA